MDALAQLALMTKAKLVFESPNTFLSFPALSPLSYTPDQLKFTTPQSLLGHTFLEFCLYANSLPQGTLFQLSDVFLWDVYQDVLSPTTQVATGALTAQESADLKNAQGVLYITDANGLQTDSPIVITYKQYRDAWFKVTQNYKSRKLTADTSNDPKVKAQWQADEPGLRAQVQKAEDDWNNKGYKAKVEQAIQVEQTIAAKSPLLQWRSWKKVFVPEIDLQTDPATNQSFALTAFSPSDIFDQHQWPTFSIGGSEIQQLVSQAPSELKNIFTVSSGNSTIESLSFEFCSAALSRPWLRPQVFGARFWRFPEPTKQLSNGVVPPQGHPQGECPAYITALVFARNIVIATRSDTGTVQQQPVQTFPPILPVFLRPDAVPIASIRTVPTPSPRPQSLSAAPPGALLARLNTATFRAVPAADAAGDAIDAPEPELSPGLRRPVVRPSPAVRPVVATTMPISMPPPLLSPSLTAGSPPPSSSPSSPPPAASQQPSASTDHISILAFICKYLPKCPNPDSTLNWGG